MCSATVRCEVDEWLQNELSGSYHVNSQCVSCELKFLTGLVAHLFVWSGLSKERATGLLFL